MGLDKCKAVWTAPLKKKKEKYIALETIEDVFRAYKMRVSSIMEAIESSWWFEDF